MRYGEPRSAGAKPVVVHQSVTSGSGPAAGAAARDPMLGCPVHELRKRLREAGLRPTRQRIALGWLLFAKGDRHITAEMLFEEASGARVRLSLATVYNTLHQFTEAGLLREIAVEGPKTYFDTNTCDHHHFLIEGSNQLFDFPTACLELVRLPEIPEGMEVARVDVVVRLRKKSAP
jgi:Fur family iron response transcriptional regulator